MALNFRAMAPKCSMNLEEIKKLLKDHVAALDDNEFLGSDVDVVALAAIGNLLQRRRVKCFLLQRRL